MGLLVVNSDFERLWNEPYPTISFDNATYSLAGEVGTTLSASFAIFDNKDVDVTGQCEITLDNDNVSIEDGMFVCDDLEVGTYQTIATATYSYKSATVTATATINISVEEEKPTSISFDSNSYSLSGTEGETITESFTVTDNLSNDVTALCSYTFSPNDTGITASNGTFDASSVLAGQYSVTVTATYGELTTTATISMTIASAVKDYLAFEALESGTFTLSIPSQVDSTLVTSVSYSTDNGSTWTTIQNDNTAKTITTPTIAQGDKVLWKGEGIAYKKIYVNTPSKFTSTGRFNVSGNIMSLLYGDNFENQTTLPSGDSYNFTSIFSNNTKLISAENLTLPATTLKTSCYGGMFSGCTSLTTAPELPATTLATGCYGSYNNMSLGMFENCTSLTTLPALNATTLVQNCYSGMFKGCTSLTTIPSNYLPATTLATGCYGSMFAGCTSLTTAPELSATTLASYCYSGMFENCTSLTTLPALNATTLVQNCYSGMFKGCTSLTTIPSNYLPATTLATGCYGSDTTSNSNGMFENCTSLTTVPSNLLPATTLADYCYSSMFQGCTSLTTLPALNATTLAGNCYYAMFKGCTSLTTLPALNATTLSGGCYGSMFQGCTGLTSVPSNYLPATTLSGGCYSGMFSGCANLTTTPTLPATTLTTYCYSDMFQGCTSLTTAPELPATTLANNCYNGMFYGCTSLTTVPSNYLPATTLEQRCYSGMFGRCTNLTTAPDLPATTFNNGYEVYKGMFEYCTSLTTAPVLPSTTAPTWYGYNQMFQGCTSLNHVEVMCTNVTSSNAADITYNWLSGVAASGTIICAINPDTNEPYLPLNSANGIPNGWTYSAPV